MRVSTRGQYGLRAMLELALHYAEGPMTLRRVAARQAISESYLEQLLGTLRRAGLVVSVRGVQGGYRLARPPEEIRVGEIIRAVEGPIAPTECVVEGGEPECWRAPHCVSRLLWEKLRDSMLAVLDSTTLADLCAEAEVMTAGARAGVFPHGGRTTSEG
ncbi:MAG: Rrf2 family transcriptional regulator [Firmicutes bacterium]|nr:Rrf2 family transcriptional regulator [Bacillota bacterium]